MLRVCDFFRREEQGSVSLWNLFWFLGFCVILGLAVDTTGAMRCARAVLPQMRERRAGTIVNISSICGILGAIAQAPYVASKWALEGISQELAQELAPRNITVNVIAPGYIETDMTGELGEDALAKFVEQIPAKRAGQPEDIAAAALFLASENAGYITGHVLAIDGGLGM